MRVSSCNGHDEPALPRLDRSEVCLTARSFRHHVPVLELQSLDSLIPCGFQDALVEHVSKGIQHGLIQDVLFLRELTGICEHR